jgi:hypothetical protein
MKITPTFAKDSGLLPGHGFARDVDGLHVGQSGQQE